MHYLLFYETRADYVARRSIFRQEHLEKAWQSHQRGELILAGAFANPIDGAVLLFKGESAKIAEEFARNDPYVIHGLVQRWYVREWTTVAGDGAATPIRPEAAAIPSSDTSTAEKSAPSGAGGILRMWKAQSSAERFSDYIRHVTGHVFPSLERIEGYRGAYLLRRTLGKAMEVIVITLWESMQAVQRFAGADPDKAIVEPRAQATLTQFDTFVTHFEILQSPLQRSSQKEQQEPSAGTGN